MKPRFNLCFLTSVFAFAVGLVPSAGAQYWTADNVFYPTIEAWGGLEGVVSMTSYPGGKLLITSSYSMIDGHIIEGKLVRLNADGTVDLTFQLNSGTLPLWSYANGAILVAMSSTGYAPYTIQRLLANGTVDPTFVGPNVEASGYSLRALVLADGRTLVYGDITSVAGVAQLGLAILKNDGTVDSSFTPSLTNGATIYYAAQTADGRILVSGQFLNQGPNSLNYLLSLNLDGSFNTAFNANAVGVPSMLYPQAGGDVLAGSNGKLLRISSAGAVDNTFVPALVGSSWKFGARKSTGEIFYLTSATGNSQLRLMHPDGSDDGSFPALTFDYTVQPGLPALSDDGSYFVGPLTGERHNARLDLTHVLGDGTIDPAYHPRFARPAQIDAYARQSDGKHLVSGLFNYVSNVSILEINGGLVRLNDDGTLDTTFVAALSRGSVLKVALQPTGKIVVYGYVQDNHGNPCNLIRLKTDGSYDDTFTPVTTIHAMWLDNAGNIYFIDSSSQLQRASPDGSIDATFQPAPSLKSALSLVLLSDGSILTPVVTDGPYFASTALVRFLHDGSVAPGFTAVPVSNLAAIAGLSDGSAVICEQNILGAYTYYYRVRHIQPDGTEDYNYATGGTNGNFLSRNVGLQIAGSLFDLLRAAAPGANAQATLDFVGTTLVCRTDGQLIYNEHGGFASSLQRWQRTQLLSPSVDPRPSIISYQPPSSAPVAPNDLFFGPSVNVSGLSPLSYQWQKNGVPIPGQNSPSFFIFSTQPSDAGTYRLVITNAAGTTATPSFDLLVETAPVFTTQPVSQTVGTGFPATFSVAASGVPTPTYQWQKNGVNVSDATASSYTIASVGSGDVGNYTVVATNIVGSVTSVTAMLAVGTPPVGFDVAAYYARNPSVAAVFGADHYGAWVYYRNEGIYDGEVFDDLFRVEEYLTLYPDLFAIFGSNFGAALDHWLSTGRIEGKLGRIPGEFSADGYFTRNPDVATAVNNDPLLAWGHYWLYGIYEGRAYDDELRVFEYLAINADLTAAFVNDWRQAALHWMRYGRTEGRLGRLPLTFSVAEYLNRSPDVAASWGTNPTTVFLHYWIYGIDENRTYDDLFRPDEYMTRYPDVAAAVGGQRRGAFKHWVRYGLPGGRIGRYP